MRTSHFLFHYQAFPPRLQAAGIHSKPKLTKANLEWLRKLNCTTSPRAESIWGWFCSPSPWDDQPASLSQRAPRVWFWSDPAYLKMHSKNPKAYPILAGYGHTSQMKPKESPVQRENFGGKCLKINQDQEVGGQKFLLNSKRQPSNLKLHFGRTGGGEGSR